MIPDRTTKVALTVLQNCIWPFSAEENFAGKESKRQVFGLSNVSAYDFLKSANGQGLSDVLTS